VQGRGGANVEAELALPLVAEPGAGVRSTKRRRLAGAEFFHEWIVVFGTGKWAEILVGAWRRQ